MIKTKKGRSLTAKGNGGGYKRGEKVFIVGMAISRPGHLCYLPNRINPRDMHGQKAIPAEFFYETDSYVKARALAAKYFPGTIPTDPQDLLSIRQRMH